MGVVKQKGAGAARIAASWPVERELSAGRSGRGKWNDKEFA